MNKTLTDAWDKAERTGEPVDIGDQVCCDDCTSDFTKSETIGGFLFGSYAICPRLKTPRSGTQAHELQHD